MSSPSEVSESAPEHASGYAAAGQLAGRARFDRHENRGLAMLKITITAVAFACTASAAGIADDLAKRPASDQLGFASRAHDGLTAAPAPGSPQAVFPEGA